MNFFFSKRLTSLGRIVVATALFSLSIESGWAADGSLDPGFDTQPGPVGFVYAMGFQEDGQLIVAGNFSTYDNVFMNFVARVNPDGSRDESFSSRAIGGGYVISLAIQTDGKILIGGWFDSVDNPDGVEIPRNNIARLNADGSLDTTFDPGAGFNNEVRSIVVQPDGKILVGGAFDTFNGFSRPGIARLNADGSLDTSFNPGAGATTGGMGGPGARVSSVVLQPDGKILIGGAFETYNGIARSGIARVNADGSLDSSFVFNAGSGLTDPDSDFPEVLSIALDGTKVLIGGRFRFFSGVNYRHIARLNGNGSLDVSFNPELIPGSVKGPNTYVQVLQAQADGEILVGGTFTQYGGVSRSGVMRLNNDSTLDTTFDPGTGLSDPLFSQPPHLNCFASQDQQFVVIGGVFTAYNGTARNYLAKIEVGPAPPPPAPKRRWVAGLDLKANEKPNRAAETAAVNSKVPEWSYGYRNTVNGTNFTPFPPEDHTNSERERDAVQGFAGSNGVVVVNTGTEPEIYFAGNVQFQPFLPDQLLIKRTSTITFPVVRWTAPENGSYRMLAKWFDINPISNGGVGHVLVNGVQIFGRQSGDSFIGQEWVDEGNAFMPTQTLQLLAGDTVDFVISTRTGGLDPDSNTDDTAFTAVITKVPTVSFAGITSPVTVLEGGNVDISVSVDHDLPIESVHLFVDEKDPGTVDNAPPFNFALTGVLPGSYIVTAVAVDIEDVVAVSPPLKVVVSKTPPSGATAAKGKKSGAVGAASTGQTYTCTQSGPWFDAATWGGAGIPGRNDDAIIPAGFEVTYNNVAGSNLIEIDNFDLGGKITSNRGIVVFGKMQASGVVAGFADPDGFVLTIAEGGSFVNVAGLVFFENVIFTNYGSSLLGGNGGVNSTNSVFWARDGVVTILGRRATNSPLTARFKALKLDGVARVELINNAYLIGLDGGSLIGNDGSTLIGNDGSTLIGMDGGSLIGNDGSTLIGNDGSTLIGLDGGSLIGNDGSTLIGLDGGSLIGLDGGSLIGNDGSTALPNTSGAALQMSKATTGVASEPNIVLEGITVSGNLNLVGSVQNNSALISPGNSPGRIRVFGDYTQTLDGTLKLEVGGTGPGQFDELEIRGAANLGGSLIIDTIDGYVPQAGDNVRAITYESKTGDFDAVTSNAEIAFGEDGMTVEVEAEPVPPPGVDPVAPVVADPVAPVVVAPTPAVVPKVTLKTTSKKIKEGKSTSFVISAPAGSIRPVTVRFAMAGTAKNRTDYTLNSKGMQVTIPNGSNSVIITLTSKKDKAEEKIEKVTMTLLPGQGYELAAPKAATVSIIDATR